MTGGLIQLAAFGSENLYLNGNPQLTYFKVVYKRHTNFAMESIKVRPKANNMLSDATSTTISFDIDRNGDLMGQTYLSVYIPNIYTYYNGDNIKPIEIKGEDTSTTYTNTAIASPDDKYSNGDFYMLRWIRKLGFYMINYASISIGTTEIDKQYGEWIAIWHELFSSKEEQELINKMIGNTEDMYFPTVKNMGKIHQPYANDASWYTGLAPGDWNY